MTTASAVTKINGGTFTIDPSVGQKQFHPYSDFLLHDVGTGDGIVQSFTQHYGKRMSQIAWRNFSATAYNGTANKIGTAPLWRVRLHSRLMPHVASVTLLYAIRRYRREAMPLLDQLI